MTVRVNRVLVEYEQDATNYSLFENGLNQYSQIDAVILDYDLNGNLVQHGTRYYLYDSENQMLATYNLSGEPNEVAVSLYSYDSFGRRVSKAMAIGVDSTIAATTESYLYDGFQVVGEYNEAGELVRRFVYGNGIDEVVAMYDVPQGEYYGYEDFAMLAASWLCTPQDACYNPDMDFNSNGIVDANDLENFVLNYYLTRKNDTYYTEIYSFAYDGLGSVVAIIGSDPNEPIVESYSYDAFGTPTIYDPNGIPLVQSAIGNSYLFTARRYDSESGLYYYRFRMYDAELGRFLQTDPIGYYDSMNLYQYCMNNPINYTDPFGESIWDEMKFVIGGGFIGHGGEVGSAIGTGALDGSEILANRLGFGLPDKFGLTNASQKICDYGGYGRASDMFARVGRDAALAAVGARVGNFNPWLGKMGMHQPHHGMGKHFEIIIRAGKNKNLKIIIPGKNKPIYIGLK